MPVDKQVTYLWMNALWMNGRLISIASSDKSVMLHTTGQEDACAYNWVGSLIKLW